VSRLFALLVVLVALASIAGCDEFQFPNQATGDMGTVGGAECVKHSWTTLARN